MKDTDGGHSNEVRELYQRLKDEAAAAGYFLNPDIEFVLDLMAGLLANQKRYGYLACPCRLAEGKRAADLDIICPCDYRDPDLDQYGTCYCALYVSEAVAEGKRSVSPIPERRGKEPPRKQAEHEHRQIGLNPEGIPLWHCSVCGYLCARRTPPLKCPVCKADRDRFRRFGW